MASDLRAFKEAVKAACESAFREDGFEWVDGRLDTETPSEERDIGCVWAIGVAEVEGLVYQADFSVGIRLYRKTPITSDPYTPRDTAKLERDLETLLNRLDDDQAFGGSVWYARAASAEIDPDVMGLEVLMVGRGDNPFMVLGPPGP